MAGAWIKVESATPDKPEVVKMARLLSRPRRHVFGCLVAVWAWFDCNSVDGAVDGIVSTDVDEIADLKGFAAAMEAVGWLAIDLQAQRMSLPNFERHNGESAKKRALKGDRQRRWRDAHVDAEPSTDASPDKNRGQESYTPLPPSKGGRAQKPDKGTPGWWETPEATFNEAKRIGGISTRGVDWPTLKVEVRKALAAQAHTHARGNGSAPPPALDPDQGHIVKPKGKFDDQEETPTAPAG